MRKKDKDIAATNRLLEVIRGKKDFEPPLVDSEHIPEEAARLEGFSIPEKKKTRDSFGLLSKKTLGLDIGSHSVKCVQLERRGMGGYRLLAVRAFEIAPEGIDLEEDPKRITVSTIKKAIEGINLKRTSIITAIGGVSTAIRQIELPFMTEKELASAIKWEARNYIPFDINDVELDYQIINTSKASNTLDIILVSVIKDFVRYHVELLREIPIEPQVIDVNPLALVNAVVFNEEIERNEFVVLMDIGDKNTTLSIYGVEGQYFVRNIMISGNDFTDDIMKGNGLSYTDAESFKKSQDSTGLIETIKPSLDNLVREVRRSLTFYENQAKIKGFSTIILTGGSATLTGLDGYLSSELGLPVEILNPFRKIDVEQPSMLVPFENDLCKLALAVGLAIRE
ncbi:MAG: type IV pilus assembly protein PilM [Syntrophobacterales bacterium]|nr:MAG: type IV pilus assembly protein PilM [Syntrophobacterales bacterium]